MIGGRVLAVAMVLVASACVDDAVPRAADGLQVATGSYPLSEMIARIGGDRVEVVDLTPAGAEPHDIELSAADLATIGAAGLVVYIGGGFQPALEDAVRERDGPTVDVLDVVPSGGDPHVWLDPVALSSIMSAIEQVLATLEPAHTEEFASAAARLREELAALDRMFTARLTGCVRRTFVTTHTAFGHLASRYDLREAGITGLSPEAEPDPARLADLVDVVRRTGVPIVFTEPLASPAIAETLARETGAAVGVLDPLEGLSEAQRAAGLDYFALMEGNLSALADALGCDG